MIFDRGGGKLAQEPAKWPKVSGGVKELGVGELGVSGDGRARCPYRAETPNSKLQTLNSQLTQGQNLLSAVAVKHG